MATLQKIRSHGALLLLIVGLAMLAFIVGDFLNSGAAFFSRSRENVGEIAGQKITIMDFEKSINQLTEVYKIESGRQDFDERMHAQIRNQVWQEAVLTNSLRNQADKIGLTVTPKEVTDLCIGPNPSPLISGRRAFADETGNYNPYIFMQFYQSMHNEEYADNAQVQQFKDYWNYWEKTIALNHLQQKYMAVLQGSIVANSIDAKAQFNARQQTKVVDYVYESYFSVADSLVKVSDSEIRSLYQQRKEQYYKQEPNRSISYIVFPVIPSEEDYKEVETWIDDLKEEFSTISLEELPLMVNANSDVLYDATNYSKNTVPEKYKDFAFSAKAGAVTEVSFEDDTYSMARLVENGYSLPDSVKLRYIYLQDNNKTQIDSIINAIKHGAKFEDMVSRYAGEADAEKIGWLTEQSLTPEISAQAMTKAKNELFTTPAGMGVQIFQVVDRTAPTPKAKLAILERKVNASSKTYGKIYNSAREFVLAHNTEAKFKEGAQEQSLTLVPATNILKNQDQINGLDQSRKIVRWAFEAKEGQVSDIFECGKNIVLATLTDVNESEYRPIAEVQMELRQQLLNDKKAEVLKQKMQGAESLEALAQTLGTDVLTAEGVRASSSYFGPAGQEPALVGEAFRLADNTLSAPVKGQRGVYVINVKQTTTESGEFNAEQEIAQLNQRYSYSIPQYGMYSVADRCLNWVESEKIKVVDNRANFY